MSEASNLRPRPVISKQQSQSEAPTTTSSSSISINREAETPKSPSRPPTLSQRAISQTLTSTANLANLLPTGTLLAFQLLMPIFTNNGMFLFDYPDPSGSGLPDLSKYRIKFIDGVHAVVSVLVFGAIALRDKNVLNCFYPMPEHETQEVLNIAPVGIGLICSLLFVVFPTRRHGIGYPITSGK
ncbi:hypothetical protein CCACVL1_16300 [Corchorus capsularis]|uniref:Uncharacterized protein n=1 Tax=Corchorus capsularis TaxID=210143 RepID=A0A1R3HXV6_COCAP|nr:hypothetical protein CCACVL1_16300 [Corchorus capsularis]